MKKIAFSSFLILQLFLVSSCEQNYDMEEQFREPTSAIPLERYDLWYLDYHNTQGADVLPFMSLAFTLSFENGIVYANNNISGIGYQGGGYGLQIGYYDQYNSVVNLDHDLDGQQRFEIRNLRQNEIEMYHPQTDTSYFLVGYTTETFDYDALFFDNIEYLLQDFEFWEKSATSWEGATTPFEYENFLRFTSENTQTFYSSLAQNSNSVAYWDFNGGYEVLDVSNDTSLKILELYYQGGVFEQFELRVLTDTSIDLLHLNSGTSFVFQGQEFIQYLKSDPKKNKTIPRKKIKRRLFVK